MKVMTVRRAGKLQSEADPYVKNLLEKIERGKTILQFRADDAVFSQGDSAEAIYFIQTGKVKIVVVSPTGKEAVLTMLGPHGFFGEGRMVGHTRSRVTHFMNKFRNLGLIDYDTEKITVRADLLTDMVMHD